MRMLRRLSLSVGFAVGVLAAVTVATVAAAGGFGISPGQYNFSDTNAFNSFFNPVDQTSVNVSVDRSMFLFKPTRGGGFQHANMTVLNVNVFTPNADPTQPPIVDAFGCFVIPDSDFTVSADLQSASLNATVDESNFCPGFLVPVTGAVTAGKGGGGGGSGFTFPLTVSATWSGPGAIQTQTDQGRFTCQTFQALTHTTTLSAPSAFTSASISGFGTFTGPNDFGNVDVSSQMMQVTGSGVLSAPCGGGKG